LSCSQTQADDVSAQPWGRADHAEVVAHESQQRKDDQHNPVGSPHSAAHHRFTLRFFYANPITWQVDVLRYATVGLGDPGRIAVEGLAFVAFTLAAFSAAV
jgi:hypothetical protein